jgi:ornithine carbamoyltransferase
VNSPNSLVGRDFLEISDFSGDELRQLLDNAAALKLAVREGIPHPLLAGRTMAMIFEKPSLRTRATFETGMAQLGGHAVDLAHEHLQMGVRESIADVGRNLVRWVDVIMARVYTHDTLTELAAAAEVPVINGLSDLSHPCQVLADLLTIREHKERLEGLKLVYVGDGFNVARSLLAAAPRLGLSITLACPEGYDPGPDAIATARALADDPTTVEIVRDPREAVAGADAVYTDSWISMGLEDETEARLRAFDGYQVDAALMALAGPDAIFMHCLPAHRGQEVTDEVMDGPQSVVFDQAENRLHTQKALLVQLIRGPVAFKELN